MLIDVLQPVLNALAAYTVCEGNEDLTDHVIDSAWRSLFRRQFARRGCPPWDLLESAIKAPCYAWRGTDERGGDVLGL